MESYRTVAARASDEFVERRSRFIGHARPVQTEEEAVAFIQELKSKHWDANHNVYAYILRAGNISRYSDDGEPQGTAGVPVLEVIRKSGVCDVAVVVTRYFGGILLGAGGLVRAYSHGAKLALDAAGIITMRLCAVCRCRCDYNQYGRVSAVVAGEGGKIQDTEFTDSVTLHFLLPQEDVPRLQKLLLDATSGSVNLQVCDTLFQEYQPSP